MTNKLYNAKNVLNHKTRIKTFNTLCNYVYKVKKTNI